MSTREYYEGVIEDVLAELGFPTDDDSAMAALLAEVGKRYDDLATQLDEYVCAEARRRLAPLALTIMEAGEESLRVPAHVVYMQWRADYMEELGEAAFDARRALDRLPVDYPTAIEVGRSDEVTDELFREAAAIGLCDPYDGPVSCYIDDAEALAAYVSARIAREGS